MLLHSLPNQEAAVLTLEIQPSKEDKTPVITDGNREKTGVS